MKSMVAASFVTMVLGLAFGQDQPSSPCAIQENHCNKYCLDGGGEETSCKKNCGKDVEACKCIEEPKCTNEECSKGCYENIKADYDCSVSYQACKEFCKNQFEGDDNCLESYCKDANEKCLCVKDGTCKSQNATGPLAVPYCKFLHKKCLTNCQAGEGEESACSSFCQADAELCLCNRKHNCASKVTKAADFQKCVSQCQALHKDTFDCDVFQKTCLGNCKTSFADDANCRKHCSKMSEDCKCKKTGSCAP